MTQKAKAKTAEDEAETDDTPFEDALARLESIVRELEGGELPLEESFARFEEGVRLARSCRSRLDALESRVAELLEDGNVRSLVPDAAPAED